MQPQIQSVTTYDAVVGTILRGQRERSGLKQQSVAERLGVTPSSFSRWETGQTALSVSQLSRLASVLGVDPTYLVSQIEQSVQSLRSRGVAVRYERQVSLENGLTNVVLGAALAGLVAQLIRS